MSIRVSCLEPASAQPSTIVVVVGAVVQVAAHSFVECPEKEKVKIDALRFFLRSSAVEVKGF
jgi:hypothetical protein